MVHATTSHVDVKRHLPILRHLRIITLSVALSSGNKRSEDGRAMYRSHMEAGPNPNPNPKPNPNPNPKPNPNPNPNKSTLTLTNQPKPAQDSM